MLLLENERQLNGCREIGSHGNLRANLTKTVC